ncbi:MAG: UMP kinase [Candidatus Krumholzibacteriota bacterium]|nr:UMP kinase [Candidatus Krumholzibacteriota bacterium]
MNRPRINRLLLKISGEVLGGPSLNIDPRKVEHFAAELKEARETGAEIAVVIGGGNIIRGAIFCGSGTDRVSADYMGMLGTVINALALQDALQRIGVETRIMTPFRLEQIVERYVRREAVRCLRGGGMVLLAGGTGNPFFTTDTAAALRAAELGADALFKGTKVDGIFDSDPVQNPQAEKIDTLSFTEVLQNDLRVMDAAAVALCRDNNIPIIVFNMQERGNIARVIRGDKIGTIVQ